MRVGTIGERAGVPVDEDQWGWSCGFYPLSHRGQSAEGTATTFSQARADVEAAWQEYLPNCTDADFAAYRQQRAWTEWKYEMWDPGCKLPTQMPDGRSCCFCGATIDAATLDRHVLAVHMAATSWG